MKVKINSLKKFCLIFFIIITNCALGQKTGCKVMMSSIDGTYSGACKNGLANGIGIAQGIDHYEGQFRNGLPQGKGTYTWANGSFYQGQWVKGLKEGIGKMVYRTAAGDSIVTGYWKNDSYTGKGVSSSYIITSNRGVVRSGFRKITDSGNDVVIKIYLGSQLNTNIEGFSMAYDSGNEFQLGPSTGIQNIQFPLTVKITYRTWNQFHSAQSDVIFEFELLEPGKWELTLTN